MNLRFIDAFSWIVRLGSFRAAAEKLNLSQAAVSSRIAALEAELNCKLFDRTSRELRLTPAGRSLVAFADRLLAIQQEMRESLGQDETVSGTVRIGVVETVVHTLLVPIVEALQSAYPALALEITAEPTRALQDHLRRGAIDVALLTDPVLEPDILNQPLCELPMGWVRRPQPMERDRVVPLAELAGGPIITFPRGSQPHAAVLEAFRAAGTAPGLLHCVTSIAAILRLVHAGMGVASMPLATVHDELAGGLLAVVPADIGLPPLPILASYRPDPASRLFDLVVDVAREETRQFCQTLGPAFARPLGVPPALD
jgi:DNA-binding transcriptional LysR family regulator